MNGPRRRQGPYCLKLTISNKSVSVVFKNVKMPMLDQTNGPSSPAPSFFLCFEQSGEPMVTVNIYCTITALCYHVIKVTTAIFFCHDQYYTKISISQQKSWERGRHIEAITGLLKKSLK